MTYLLAFLEGIITFVSPCLLPMLPLYLTYFAGQNQQNTQKRTLLNALAFVLGFTLIFVAMGAFAGTLGSWLLRYQRWVNLAAGGIVILFGLSYLGLFKTSFFHRVYRLDRPLKTNPGFLSSLMFGLIFSIGWTPCVGAFLGSALMLAASTGQTLQGILMLLAYAMGLGIPFILSALLLDRLKSTFNWIKAHYRLINLFSGSLLILMGLLMASGYLARFLSFLSF